MKSRTLKAIAAMSQNRVIGKDGAIPWRISDELRWFKEATSGSTVVMGRKTYDSLGRPLPNRRNFVLSRNAAKIEGVHTLSHLPSDEEWSALVPEGETIWVIGGADLYAQLLPRCEELYLTVVGREAEGDAYFPAFEEAFLFDAVVKSHPEFEVRRYLRR